MCQGLDEQLTSCFVRIHCGTRTFGAYRRHAGDRAFPAGEASVTLGDDKIDASAGTWAHMPAQLSHSILARTPVVMVLRLLNSG